MRWGAGLPGTLANAPQRRLLVIYDFASQPFSIGDILIFQEASLILRERHNLDLIDFALVYNRDTPVVPDPAFSAITKENFLFHLSSVLPAAQVNPHLGSLLLFDSHGRLEQYIADNSDTYTVWPTLEQYGTRDYLFYYCFNTLFTEHYEEHGSLPVMQSREAASSWAKRFIADHSKGAVPVTIQVRRNRANPGRDANYDAWLSFMAKCAERYPVKFFIVCSRSEIDERFRELSNAVVVKDYGTILEQDLAILESGLMHMGMASGPATIVNFSAKPYCLFKWDINLETVHGIVQDGYRYRFNFANPLQNWIFMDETPEMLMVEFERLWAAVNPGSTSSPK